MHILSGIHRVFEAVPLRFTWDPVEFALNITWSGVTYAISGYLISVLVLIALGIFVWRLMTPEVMRED
jgi:hypothetical protein